MKSVNLREAKASLSALVDAAEHGELTTITKHGRPAAVVIPFEMAERLIPSKPNFADFLMSIPAEGIDFERNQSTGREFEF